MHASLEPPSFRNELLAALRPEDQEQIGSHLTHVRLVKAQVLHEHDERIEHVYFVDHGMVSIVAETNDAPEGVEVGVVGREGMVGLNAVLDDEATSYGRAMVQMAGTARRMTADAMRRCSADQPAFRKMLMRSVQAFMAQSAQTAACNGRHSLSERCARWLLTAHDRADSDELPLTHELLSIMLAVRRPGVSEAVGALANAGLIEHSRGRIVVLDRSKLEEAACDCHERTRQYTDMLWLRPL